MSTFIIRDSLKPLNYLFSLPLSRLARHLQKEAVSQPNNSEFTEDQKVHNGVGSFHGESIFRRNV